MRENRFTNKCIIITPPHTEVSLSMSRHMEPSCDWRQTWVRLLFGGNKNWPGIWNLNPWFSRGTSHVTAQHLTALTTAVAGCWGRTVVDWLLLLNIVRLCMQSCDQEPRVMQQWQGYPEYWLWPLVQCSVFSWTVCSIAINPHWTCSGKLWREGPPRLLLQCL